MKEAPGNPRGEPERRATGSQPQPVPLTDFDFSKALKRLCNDQKLFLDLIQFFQEDSVQLLHEMRQAAEGHDAEKLHRAAHSIKGLCANFDAVDAMNAARRIEQLAESRNLRHVPAVLATLEAETARLTKALEAFRRSCTAEEK